MTDETYTETVDEDRRDFIHIAAGAAVAGGAGALAWPFIAQMLPALDTRAASSLEVPITDIPEGGEIRVLIGGKPFFIRHRTAAEIAAAESVEAGDLPDPQTDEERLVARADGTLNPAILVVSGSCTHLGCVPVGPGSNTGEFGGCRDLTLQRVDRVSVLERAGRHISERGRVIQNIALDGGHVRHDRVQVCIQRRQIGLEPFCVQIVLPRKQRVDVGVVICKRHAVRSGRVFQVAHIGLKRRGARLQGAHRRLVG